MDNNSFGIMGVIVSNCAIEITNYENKKKEPLLLSLQMLDYIVSVTNALP